LLNSMSLEIEKSIDNRGFLIIVKGFGKPRVLIRVWAMPSEKQKRTYDVYILRSSMSSTPLYKFHGGGAGYFRIKTNIPEKDVDSLMKSQLESSLKTEFSVSSTT